MLASQEKFEGSNSSDWSNEFQRCQHSSRTTLNPINGKSGKENYLKYSNFSPKKSAFGDKSDDTSDNSEKKRCRDIDELAANFSKLSFELNKWYSASEAAKSSDPATRYEGTLLLRAMLSADGEIPIQAVVDTGIVPTLVGYLSSSDFELQFEAAWALTNIASGTKKQTEVVVSSGCVAGFVHLLRSEREEIREQGMWGIANIAGDRDIYRDKILSTEGSVELLLKTIRNCSVISTIRTGIWAICNLSRGRPRPDIKLVLPFVSTLINVLDKYSDCDILSDACWALDGISEKKEGMDLVVEQLAIPRLVSLLGSEHSAVQRPALRVIGQISTGDAKQTQLILDAGAAEALTRLLGSSRRSIRKDACWALSNIAAGDEKQLQNLFDCNVFPTLLALCRHDEEVEVKREAAWVICNSFTTGSFIQVCHLIGIQCAQLVCELLESPDEKMVETTLDALLRILQTGDEFAVKHGHLDNPCTQIIAKADGFNKMALLQGFPNSRIHSKVSNILSSYAAI